MAQKHPGFKAAAAKISAGLGSAGSYGSKRERANAILAARSRGASPAAKRANPRLKRVLGGY